MEMMKTEGEGNGRIDNGDKKKNGEKGRKGRKGTGMEE